MNANTTIAQIINQTDLRYYASKGANASKVSIINEVSLMDRTAEILEAFGTRVEDDGAALVAAQVFMIEYITQQDFYLPAAMLQAQQKIERLSEKSYYKIKNVTVEFILDAVIETVQTNKEKIPGKRGRSRNDFAWELAEAEFLKDMTRTYPEMVEAITTVFQQNDLDCGCVQMVKQFEEKHGTLSRDSVARKGRAKNMDAWKMAETIFDAIIAENPSITFNGMCEQMTVKLQKQNCGMVAAGFVLKFEEQNGIKLQRGKRGRPAKMIEMA
jgi:hypothetical protein